MSQDTNTDAAVPSPSLAGRTAQCRYCRKENPSDQPLPGYTVLPFFEHCPNSDHDWFYCGCYGWE